MRDINRKNLYILIIVTVILVIQIFLFETSLLQRTGGKISFPTDDAFLEITTARTLAFEKIWGLSQYAFQSASSSLLYPIILALIFFITGAHLIIPIILNTVLAAVFIYFLQQALIRRNSKPLAQAVILLTVMTATFLPVLAISGTDRCLQLLVCFLFIDSLATSIHANKANLPRQIYWYGALAMATRCEDLLLIILACLLLISLHRGRQALKLAVISLLPVLAFGTISLVKNNYFIPTPLVTNDYPGFLPAITALALIVSSILILRRQVFPILIIMAVPFAINNAATLWHFQRDSVRIYEDQFPVATFIHRYYNRWNIGINNVGAVAWFSEGRKLDLTGDISVDVARSKKEHTWCPWLADSLTKKNGVNTIIVSNPWFTSDALPSWAKVASWKLPDTQSGTGKTYNFYVVHIRDTAYLQKRLHDFEPLIPAGATVVYY